MQEEASARATKDTDWCMVLALPQLDPKQQRPGNTCSQGDLQLKEDFSYLSNYVTSRHASHWRHADGCTSLLPHSALLFPWCAQVTISTIDAIAATLFVQEGARPATC